MLALKAKISSIVKVKDDATVELVKVVNQVNDRKGLIKGKKDTIFKSR
jgi:hypothetical protein